jgi:hypothetical protein|tara:strand:+ start:936 stop:1364 length:429 start_codon:yes stop_codon:yes gene_type:complete
MSYASGKRSLAISDRSGQAFPYREMVKEWTGALVHISEFEPKHPQLDPPYHKADPVALKNPRVQRFQQPTNRDGVLADSGGTTVGIANLTLPGDFAFRTQYIEIIRDGVTTVMHSMIPEDPSLQNRRRQLNSNLGSVEVSIT